MKRVGPWLLVALALAAGAYFSGLPWVRSREALSAALEARTEAAQARAELEALKRGSPIRFPQSVRYTARGDVVDVTLETMRWPDEPGADWKGRANEAWSAFGFPPPDSIQVKNGDPDK